MTFNNTRAPHRLLYQQTGFVNKMLTGVSSGRIKFVAGYRRHHSGTLTTKTNYEENPIGKVSAAFILYVDWPLGFNRRTFWNGQGRS